MKALSGDLLRDYVLGEYIGFETNDIFEKYGFGDGDLLSDLFYEYVYEVKGIGRNMLLKASPAWHMVFAKCIEPEISSKVRIVYGGRDHNDIRCWDAGNSGESRVRPETALVRLKDFLKVFDEYIETQG